MKSINIVLSGVLFFLLTGSILLFIGEHTKPSNENNLYKVYEYIFDVKETEISKSDLEIYNELIKGKEVHIIIGSFKDIKNAKKLSYIYPKSVILPIDTNGYHMVSLSKYPDYDISKAIIKLEYLRTTNNDSTYWLLLKDITL